MTTVDQSTSNLTIRRDSHGRVTSESALVDGLLDGETVLYSNGKVSARIPYRRGKQQGEALYFGKTGEVLVRSRYEEGLLEGESKYFDQEGRLLRKSMYRRGMLHGRTVEYYPDGAPREISQYAEDLLDGDVFRFNERGEMVERVCYAAGRRKACGEAKG